MSVSVILPLYNCEDLVPDAVRQLKALESVSFEALLIDDGSTDGSAAVARAETAGDSRFTVISLPANRGVAAARKVGVEAAVGEWVWFVDSDDRWPSDALLKFLRSAGDADVIVASAQRRSPQGALASISTPDGRWTPSEALSLLFRGLIKGHLWNKLFRAEVLAKVSFLPSPVHSDLSMVLEALAFSSVVRGSADVVYEYVPRAGSIITSSVRRWESLEVVNSCFQRVMVRYGSDPHLKRDANYFENRFILLSALKSTIVVNTHDDVRALRRDLRARLSASGIVRSFQLRDFKRGAMMILSRLSDRGAVLSHSVARPRQTPRRIVK